MTVKDLLKLGFSLVGATELNAALSKLNEVGVKPVCFARNGDALIISFSNYSNESEPEPKNSARIDAFGRVLSSDITDYLSGGAIAKTPDTPKDKLLADFTTYKKQCYALDVEPESLETFKRAQVKQHKKGIKKYKTSLIGAKLTIPELRQHILEEMVDCIDYRKELKRTENV